MDPFLGDLKGEIIEEGKRHRNLPDDLLFDFGGLDILFFAFGSVVWGPPRRLLLLLLLLLLLFVFVPGFPRLIA